MEKHDNVKDLELIYNIFNPMIELREKVHKQITKLWWGIMEKYVSKERFLSDIEVQTNILEDMVLYHNTNAEANPHLANSEVQLSAQYLSQQMQLEEVKTLVGFCDEFTLYKEEDGMFYVENLSEAQYKEFMDNINESLIPYQ